MSDNESQVALEEQDARDPRRRLPPVDRLLQVAGEAGLVEVYGREPVTVHARRTLERLRQDPRLDDMDLSEGVLLGVLAATLEDEHGAPARRVLNATGVLLHTNLGRAPLPRSVVEDVAPLLTAASDVELDLASGRRGDRNRRVASRLRALTGAEAALVVNNNAAAIMLVLAAMARGREVIVSRGELVEIGGSFRIPDILEASGARLVEVGTTNRTRVADYEAAIGAETALLLKVFPSNYRINGFTESVRPAELADLARRHGLPSVIDEGSGLVRSRTEAALRGHPSLRRLVADGCDLACGSGDKLLGGPQAGLLVGRREAVERCRRHPLYRALRPGRMVLAALEAVLDLHLKESTLPLDGLFAPPLAHRRRLARLVRRWRRDHAALPDLRIVPAAACIGGGSAPEEHIDGEALAIAVDGGCAARLRIGQPPVVGRMRDGELLLDLRTVDPGDDAALMEALRVAVEGA